jgi:glycosyltransferase involved in cell wall biosynthesis
VKLTILFSALANYTVAFFRHLAQQERVNIQLVYQPTSGDAPYKGFDLSFCSEVIEDTKETKSQLPDRVRKFGAKCILMASWNYAHFMELCRELRTDGKYVVATMDNQWRGSPKQWVGVLSSSLFLKPSIDTFLVAGDRQAQFAKRLGYPSVMYGYYAADIERFSKPADERNAERAFLFMGRLVPEKGVAELLAAYSSYRATAKHPWKLIVVGTGQLKHLVDRDETIDYRGFVQPDSIPTVMAEATAFVLPSRFEPWGVVIHEAAASGLPIICTTPCGASTYFVRDGVNGFLVANGVQPLADAMTRMSEFDELELSAMSEKSRRLAALWSPSMLARYFRQSVSRVIGAE